MIKLNSCLAATSRTCLALIASIVFLTTSVMANEEVWVRVHHSSDEPRLAASGQLDSLADYGTFQWGPVAASMVDDLRDQGLRLTVMDDPFTLDLGGMRFDPLTEFPEGSPTTAGDGPDFHLVQFQGPIRSQWVQNLRGAGIEPVQYIHPYSYVVWADQSQLAAARSLDAVRATAEFAVEFRVLPQQRERDATVVPTMALVSRQVEEDTVRAQLEAAGATVHDFTRVTAHTSVVHLDVSGDRYWDLAQIPALYTIQYIPPETGPRGEMSNQSIVGNHGPAPGHELFPGYATWLTDTGYDGSGVVVGIVDGGIRESHQDLVGRISPCVPSGDSPTSCSTSNNTHGTHVAAAVAGTGVSGVVDSAGFLRGQGVAPGANVIQQRYGAFLGGGPGSMIPDGMLKIYRESALSGALLTNNSWGPTGSPQGYDIPTQQIDIITRDATPEISGNQGVLPVWSIMNGNGDSGGACSPSSLGSPDEAKNLFGVGSTRMQISVGNQYSNIFDVSPNSGHGPTCDGRTGLHIVAPGCSTDSATAGSNSAYGLSCGTSMASPVVSGAVSIFVEYYRDLFAEDPSPAMMKAAVTAVATNLHGYNNADGGTITETPSRFQGYGRLDLDAVVNAPYEVMYFDQEHVFTEAGQDWTLPLIADDPNEPVRLMLMWTDAPGHGLGGTTPAWVNDLDLIVETGADTYLGNVIGNDGFSESGGTADHRNNAEAVFLRPDQHAGNTFDVTVAAIDISADALNPHNPEDPAQDFALVCYNCQIGDPTFTLEIEPEATSFCIPESGSDDLLIDVMIGVVGDYSETVNLSASGEPAGVTSSFDPAAVAAPGNSVLTLSVDAAAETGSSEIQVIGDDGEEVLQSPLMLTLEAVPEAVELVEPEPGAVDVALQPEFVWVGLDGVNDYQIQVATDDGFSDLVIDETVSATSFIPGFTLDLETDYYWRVRGQDHCGDGAWSDVSPFQTRFDPIADVNPAEFEFVVNTGQSDNATLSIENVGTGVLNWSLSTSPCEGGTPAGWLSINPGSGNTEAGTIDTVDVSVSTDGLAIGSHQGEICVNTNQAGVGPISVPVDLEVLDLPPGDIVLSPSSLAFGQVGTTQSRTLDLMISNQAEEGSAGLHFNQIEVISGQSYFELITNDCPEALPPQESCSIEVRFTPTALTSYSGVLRVRADGQSHNVSLVGQGIEPEPEIFQDRFEP